MKILICNERFLFRFGVDRCLLMLSDCWIRSGHKVVLMGTKKDPKVIEKSSCRFIQIPESPDYLHGNDFTLHYLQDHWNEWFNESVRPDLVLVAGWPFYQSIRFFREKCGCVIFHDYGAVPVEGMSEGSRLIQNELRRLRKDNLPYASRIIAISHFLEETQSKPDVGNSVPTSFVHCGVDHIEQQLWDNQELNLGRNDVLQKLTRFKEERYKLIFQPGRWENGNYKNSSATIGLSRYLLKKGIHHKILVLSTPENMGELPDDVSDAYFCLGFLDDRTMKNVMELSDVGVSPTLWEGFDLPLGEMQYLNKYMFVLNVGAHPEVVSHPYFLCRNMAALSRKTAALLQGKKKFSDAEFDKLCTSFRQEFTWAHCAGRMLDEFHQALLSSSVLFIDVTNASHDTANSGVMRVTRKLSRHLQTRINTVFVLWDQSIDRFVLPYPQEVEILSSYGGPLPSSIQYTSIDGQPRRLMEELLPFFANYKKSFLFTETVRHETLEKAIPWLHGHQIACAAIFYDAIPVMRPEFCSREVAENHAVYMAHLADLDLIIPIQDHNRLDLLDYWNKNGIETRATIKSIDIATEIDGFPRNREKLSSCPERKQILFVSTLEPRKNHIRFLKALDILFCQHPELPDTVSFHLVGNRYAGNDEIPQYVEQFCASHPNVQWLGVIDDQQLKAEYSSCAFTVYPSEIEGFGMPIMESLWAGKPCLCSNGGSIGSLASAGGCCMTDVMNPDDIAASLFTMISNSEYFLRLQHQAADRFIQTWDQYAQEVALLLSELSPPMPFAGKKFVPYALKYRIRNALNGWQGTRLILVSNNYPPQIVGGAEIIAHKQFSTLIADGLVNGVVFSLDPRERFEEGSVYTETVDNVFVVRLCVPPSYFDQNALYFFHPVVNNVFRELCSIVQPDVVHCHNLVGMSLGIVDIAKQTHAKVFFTLHDNWGFCYKNTCLNNSGSICSDVLDCENCLRAFVSKNISIPMGIRKSYFRRIFERSDAFISPSRYLAHSYIRAGFDTRKMHVLWNGIDVAAYSEVSNSSADSFRISYAGNFGAHKGVDILIRAIGMLPHDDIMLNLVGKGPEEQHYRELLAEYKLLNRVRFHGQLSNEEMVNVYRETDLYCLPSVWPENQPVSITEAMACGIPVVASDVGGCCELVQHEKTGYLFEAGNVRELSGIIEKLYTNRALLSELGKSAREFISEDNFHMQVKKLSGFYDHCPFIDPVESKKIILVKGAVIPIWITHFSAYDLIPWDWVLHPADLEQSLAVMLLPGESLAPEDLKIIGHYQLTVILESSQKKKYQDYGINLIGYPDEEVLLRIISSFS